MATWHTRWPDLPASVVDGLLERLAELPSYRTPQATPAHTRHYLPDLDHRSGETGRTDLTLDPFLAVPRTKELLVRWDVALPVEQRQALAKLAELLPYLGRAESVCQARLLDVDAVPDSTWWRPGVLEGSQHVRLLAVTPPASRTILEMTTSEVRKGRRTMPPGTMWATYSKEPPSGTTARRVRSAASSTQRVTAIRFAVTGRIPIRETHSVLLADEAHQQFGKALIRAGFADADRKKILGSNGATTDHGHAHWIPLATGQEQPGRISSLIIWVPHGLKPDEVAAVIPLSELSGQRGGGGDAGGYDVKGFPRVKLLFQSAGPIEQVAPELSGPSRRWRSQTPYLPVRHRKREPLGGFLTADVRAELGYRPQYRALPPPSVALDEGNRWALSFRRYRMNETMAKSRAGVGLRLEFAEPVTGPLLLGQLSHFGYGMFVPDLK